MQYILNKFGSSEVETARALCPLPHESPTSSFWHSEPSQFLLGHRTTAELPEYADVVIVGSGITGAHVAHYLLDHNQATENTLRVIILEAREACWGATGRNGGHCQPLLFSAPPQIGHFEVRNWHAVRDYIGKHNVDCEWREAPGCRSIWKQELLTVAEKLVKDVQETDPELGRLMQIVKEKDVLRRKYQLKANKVAGAVITETAASLWPYKLVAFMLEQLVTVKGLNLQTTTSAERIEPYQQVNEGSKRISRWTVQTNRGSVHARHVVLATNAYTSHLLPRFADLIVPVRGEMSALKPLPKSVGHRLPTSHGFIGASMSGRDDDDYLIQRPFSGQGLDAAGGELLFGGGRGLGRQETVGNADDSVIDEASAQYLRAKLLELLDFESEDAGTEETVPKDELDAVAQWTGIMGYSRDERPWVGGVPGMAGVWMSAGYTGHGMPNAPLCGKAIADMILKLDAKSKENIDPQELALNIATIQLDMIEKHDLPEEYLLTEPRIQSALRKRDVLTMDKLGAMGMGSGTRSIWSWASRS